MATIKEITRTTELLSLLANNSKNYTCIFFYEPNIPGSENESDRLAPRMSAFANIYGAKIHFCKINKNVAKGIGTPNFRATRYPTVAIYNSTHFISSVEGNYPDNQINPLLEHYYLI